MQKTEKGNREKQEGGEGHHQGNPMPQEPTNKQKPPPPTDAAEAARAQPPEPAQVEVRKLMDACGGEATAQREEEEHEWKKVGKRGHSKNETPQNPPPKNLA